MKIFKQSTPRRRKWISILIILMISLCSIINMADAVSTAACADISNINKKCCTGQDDQCKTQNGGIFCWCDEHCLVNNDCCWDYNIECVPGSSVTIVNTNTGKGNHRASYVVSSTTPMSTTNTTSSTSTTNTTSSTSTTSTTSSTSTTSTTSSTSTTSTTSSTITSITIPTSTTVQTSTTSLSTNTKSTTPPMITTSLSIEADPTVQQNKTCHPFPSWLNIKINTTTAQVQSNQTVVYQCITGFQFEIDSKDGEHYRQNLCDMTGEWSSTFSMCIAESSISADAQYLEPVEAPGAIYIGSVSFVFIIVEMTIIGIMDLHHLAKRFKGCTKAYKPRPSKPDVEMSIFSVTPSSVQTNTTSMTVDSTSYDGQFKDIGMEINEEVANLVFV